MSNSDNVRWYSYFKSKEGTFRYAVMDQYSSNQLLKMFVISYPTEYGVYKYAVMRDHVELYKYIERLPERCRIFHEVPLEFSPQKPRFDIDICENDLPEGTEDNLFDFGEKLRETLLQRISETLLEDGIVINPEENFLIYNTHRKGKYSSHVIIYGYYHTDLSLIHI